MATCKKCGKPLILKGGRCVYCQHLSEGNDNQHETEPIDYKKANIHDGHQARGKNASINYPSETSKNTSICIARVLFALLLIEIVVVCIIEFIKVNEIHGGWYVMGIMGFSFLMMTSESLNDVKKGVYAKCKMGIRLYNEYFHFLIKMLCVFIGHMIVLHFEFYLVCILLAIICLFVIISDSILHNTE